MPDREPRDVLGEALWATMAGPQPWLELPSLVRKRWRQRADAMLARLAEAGYRIMKEGERVMPDREPRFVVCPECDGSGVVPGYGVVVYGRGCGFSHVEDNEERCPECQGTGEVERDVRPLTLEEALELDAEKLEALGALLPASPRPATGS